jgi:two-component system, NarL family, nitrate/nitrite response regulator NarL
MQLEKSPEVPAGSDEQGSLDIQKLHESGEGSGDSSVAPQTVRVLIADRDPMTSDLLATALGQDSKMEASGVRASDLLPLLEKAEAHVVVIGAGVNHQAKNSFDLADTVRRIHPGVLLIILLDESTPDSVISAFRSGARGVISRQRPVAEFRDCVDRVRQGYIFAGKEESTFLLEAFRSAPLPSLSVKSEALLLSAREFEVVQCAAKGKTNKVIASELGISEHTVKNCLFRAFEKLGVSNRVQLLVHLAGLQEVPLQ